ncbi:hypothetical protein TWF696_006471 [Orbilia brochopaga]|uniref:Uncharacterized protein n=1 Tax=Orbilia brochopaga TaxID=3140254 RepID=A0AAV9UWF8_9PEZI
MQYPVYRVEYLGNPVNHEAIFVQTNENGPRSGHLYHVIGSIQRGMMYEEKPARHPEDSEAYVSKHEIGSVSAIRYSRVDTICRSITPPEKQFEGARKLYPGRPLRRCGEWTAEVIAALREAEVLL